MTKEELQGLKDDYVNHLKKHMVEAGGMFSHLALFGNKKESGERAVVHIVVDAKHIASEEDKENFLIEVLPGIASKVKQEFTLDAVAWTSEAWMRSSDKEFNGNWQALPIQKEVLIIMYQEKDAGETIVLEIKRDGKVINSEGDLIDNINLVELPDLSQAMSVDGKPKGRLHEMMKVFI